MKFEIARICVPTDFSEASDLAVHYGAELARAHGAELHLLHVLEHSDALVHHPDFTNSGEVARAYFNELQVDALHDEPRVGNAEQADREAHDFLRQLESGVGHQWKEHEQRTNWWDDLVVHRAVRCGRPAEEICRYARHYLIDQLIMPTHARSGWVRLFMGSVTERVVQTSPCPVVGLRFPAHESKMAQQTGP